MQLSPSAMTALVADSSRYGSRVLRDILVRSGIGRVVEAEDGAEALAALAERKPDLLVLDWELPVISAREILAMARDGSRPRSDLPVIVTMPAPTRSQVDAALALEVDAILAAPYSPRAFQERLRHVLAPRP